jgi:hypothetical protein
MMKSWKKIAAAGLALAVAGVLGAATVVLAHPAGGPGRGGGMCGPGRGMGPGGGHGGGDMRTIHALFAQRDQIRRTVTQIPGGVRTTTESDDPAVVQQLREHVQAMYARLEEGRPINARDPLFAALFEHADEITFRTENTAKGITVTETSRDPEVVGLIRRHAEVVNRFIANGMPEMMRAH